MASKKGAKDRSSDEELPRVVPTLPDRLSLKEIATLAGVKLTTMRTYRQTKVSNLPDPVSTTSGVPFWAVDDIIDWLANRHFSRTVVEKQPDGSLQVARPSDYYDRKAKGEIGRAHK